MKINTGSIMVVAERARQHCVDKNIIEEEQTSLSKEDLINIVKVFGGKLEFTRKSDLYKKINEKEYKIYCDEEKEDYVLNALAGLGRAFFDGKYLKDNESVKINELESSDNYGYERYKISRIFANEFLMPRNIFEKVILKYSDDGKCKVDEVAKTYKISIFAVLEHGQELHNW